MAETFSTIDFVIDEGLAVLTLNRPEKLNSFNTEMFAEIRQAFKQIRPENGVRCLLITGAGRGFCAGQDLGDRSVSAEGKAPNLSQSVENNYNPLVRAIAGLEMPVVCAVNGVAAGAGSSIALGCDLVFAARSASFIQSFSRIGLIPDSGWHLAVAETRGACQSNGIGAIGRENQR